MTDISRSRAALPRLALLLLATLLTLAILPPAPASGAETQATFDIGQDVSAQDAGFVIEGIRLAQDFFIDRIGVAIPSPVNVTVRDTVSPVSDGQIAVARKHDITVYTGSPGWQITSPAERYAVVIHEYTHFYQYLVLGDRDFSSPAWFDEGFAEFLSVTALAEWGVLDLADIETYWATLLALQPVAESLDELESWPVYQDSEGAVYPLSYFAVAQLFDDGNLAKAGAYYDAIAAGQSFDAAFQTAFALTPDQHYANVQTDLEAPPPSPDLPADILVYEPVERSTPIRAGFLPRALPAGEQVLVEAQALPASVCTLALTDRNSSAPLLERATFADGTGDVYWFVTIPADPPGSLVMIDLSCGGQPIEWAAMIA
jgi:hypothetical protein